MISSNVKVSDCIRWNHNTHNKASNKKANLNRRKEVTALVPCRAGSERVPNKNTRQFANSSLIQIKLKQLSLVPVITRVNENYDHATMSTGTYWVRSIHAIFEKVWDRKIEL
jgi:hypothetical protein